MGCKVFSQKCYNWYVFLTQCLLFLLLLISASKRLKNSLFVFDLNWQKHLTQVIADPFHLALFSLLPAH